MKMKTNTGFTLIEVLISMLILAIGLLGLAGLQATGIRNNLSAYNRSQATQLAYDMADRMRANVTNSGALGASVYITMDPDDAAVQATCNVAPGCSPALMAQQDLFEWNRDLTDILTSGVGTIGVVGTLFTITVSWDDDRDQDTADLNFPMSFQL